MKFKILLNTFYWPIALFFTLLLAIAFNQFGLKEYFPIFLPLLFFVKSILDVFNKERRFLTDYVDQAGIITFHYLDQFARSRKIEVPEDKIQQVTLLKKIPVWRPFDVITIFKQGYSFTLEFKDEKFREFFEQLSR